MISSSSLLKLILVLLFEFRFYILYPMLDLKLGNMPYIDRMLCETESIEFNALLYNKKSD